MSKVAHRRKRKSKAMAVAAAAMVPLMAIPVAGTTSPVASAAFEYFPQEPTRVLTLSLLPGGNDDDLMGVMCQSPRTCQNVIYSRANSPAAVATLNAALRDGTTGKQIVFAYSQGARVAGRWLIENEGTEGAPSVEDMSFVLMGNPSRKYGGSDRDWEANFPETAYKVIDVSQEYDLASDFPDDRNNWLAMINANAAFFFTHQDYETVDIYDEANYVWVEGNTTYVFVPTEKLPMLTPLRWFGLGFVADALNAPLKEIIDRAYDRSYLPATPGLPSAAQPETQALQADISSATITEPASEPAALSRGKHAAEDDDVLVEPVSEETVADVEDSPADEDGDGGSAVADDAEADEDAADEAAETDTEAAAAKDDDSADDADRPTRKGDTEKPSERDSSKDDGASGDSE
ncbi:PE-PPE domain-containing protein [Mycobacterium sp. 236(2023)]|uniref:PE-PPE domain-containing protein n=1 Tax=Mycobacterium sp. 236(2023) TaxID=3038163 RepID=UPI002414DB95|nr:PE-PPE domain-containing protein [Mycobacterium sp. 236(2023)]MDG4666900.1 PE-PPE domain-containing protein [Mycobacterium sp. 236(2023)]